MDRRAVRADARAGRPYLCWLVGYPSGQRGQTVNLLAYAFDGSNPSPTTSLRSELRLAGHLSLFAWSYNWQAGEIFYSVPFFNLCAFENFLAVCKPIGRRDFFIASPGVLQ